MTVQTSTNVASFNGDGANKAFPISYKFNSAADLVVTLIDDEAKTTQILTLNSDFTVTGAGDEEGGVVTLVVAPTAVQRLKVTRVVDILQLTDLRNQGKFYAEIHEDVFDLLIMIDQQQQTEIDDANAKSDEAVAIANEANAKSGQAVAKAGQNLIDMQAQYDAFEQGASLEVIGDYAAGLIVDAYNKVFRKDGELHRAAASLDLPYTLTGNWATESVNFVSVGDAVLRQDLANATDPAKGAGMVGYKNPALLQSVPITISRKHQERVSIFEWESYASGDDWTLAFEKAWAELTDPNIFRIPVQGSEPSWMVQKGPKLYLPEGYYQYAGSGLPMEAGQSSIFELEGAGFQSVRLDITSDAYFIDAANAVGGFASKGLHVHGGKGFLRMKSQAVTTNRPKFIREMVFSEYTECAIASQSQDAPYTKIRDCMFRGRADRSTIGIALAGYMAGSEIDGCVFQRNRYHLKLATAVLTETDKGPCVPINVSRNDFMRYPGGPSNTYDVWLVPNVETSNNAGRAAVFSFNKFGAENVKPGDAHVIIAREDDPASIATSHHNSTVGGFVNGLRFASNNVGSVGGDGTRIPFIYSNTVGLFSLDVDDIYDNGSPALICEYAPGVSMAASSPQSTLNTVNARQDLSAARGNIPAQVTNLPGTWQLLDPQAIYADDAGMLAHPGGDAFGGYVNLLAPASTAGFASASVTRTAINNSIGEINEASEVTMTASDGRIVGALTFESIVSGRQAIFEGELLQGVSNSLQSVRVTLTDQSGRLILRREYRLTTGWRKFRIPFVPNTTGITGINVRIDSPSDYAAGSRTTFRVGRVAVYHAYEPVNTGHVKALNSSWSRQHMVLGGYHLWVDSSGRLRIKSGSPTSDTDGAIVGAQA